MPSIAQDKDSASPARGDLEKDGLDDLFDYDPDMDAFFRGPDKPGVNTASSPNQTTTQSTDTRKQNSSGAGLGIDEEIKVVKKREPIPKLDEDRILSAKGIPKLRKISKERLKFKGKGHEYSDVARLLNMYQLWLDDLYPRAKFLDALSMVEKLGHKKRLQVMRKQWIDEGKPKAYVSEDDDMPEANNRARADESADLSRGDELGEQRPRPEDTGEDVEQRQPIEESSLSTRDGASGGPEEDELDALLAENIAEQETSPGSLFGPGNPEVMRVSRPVDEFADEMEVLAEMDDW